jgi:hypothetical protein
LAAVTIRVKLDNLFRKVLLKKAERKDGLILCPLTGRYLTDQDVHVCHYIPREYTATRYDTDNCILCAVYSNITENNIIQDNKKSLHINKFEKFLGPEKVEMLNKKKQEKVSTRELKELEDQFKKFLKDEDLLENK